MNGARAAVLASLIAFGPAIATAQQPSQPARQTELAERLRRLAVSDIHLGMMYSDALAAAKKNGWRLEDDTSFKQPSYRAKLNDAVRAQGMEIPRTNEQQVPHWVTLAKDGEELRMELLTAPAGLVVIRIKYQAKGFSLSQSEFVASLRQRYGKEDKLQYNGYYVYCTTHRDACDNIVSASTPRLAAIYEGNGNFSIEVDGGDFLADAVEARFNEQVKAQLGRGTPSF